MPRGYTDDMNVLQPHSTFEDFNADIRRVGRRTCLDGYVLKASELGFDKDANPARSNAKHRTTPVEQDSVKLLDDDRFADSDFRAVGQRVPESVAIDSERGGRRRTPRQRSR